MKRETWAWFETVFFMVGHKFSQLLISYTGRDQVLNIDKRYI